MATDAKFKIRVVTSATGKNNFGVVSADHYGAKAYEDGGTLVVTDGGDMVARYSMEAVESWAMLPGDVDLPV